MTFSEAATLYQSYASCALKRVQANPNIVYWELTSEPDNPQRLGTRLDTWQTDETASVVRLNDQFGVLDRTMV